MSGHKHSHACSHSHSHSHSAITLTSTCTYQHHHHHDGHHSSSTTTTARHAPSWRRLWTVLIKEHQYLGLPLYTSQLQLLLGLLLCASALTTPSLSLQSYGFLVIFNSLTLFITLVPQLAEYSHNNSVSVGLPWGLGALPGLLQFTNGLVVVYRAVQALREGVEHLVMRNAHGVSAGGAGGAGGGMGVPCVVMATMCVAVYSALGHRRQQYVGLLVAGAWMLGSAILAGERGELVEPLGCILMAVVMALVGIPTCVQEGRILLLASSPSSSDDAAAGDRTEAERVRAVARVPGVVGFEGRTWAVARETYTAVRVEVENDSLAADVLEKTADVLKSSGLGAWTVELRLGKSKL